MPDVSLLVILDGFGHRLETENNAIALASTPTWDRLLDQRPHTLISGSGLDVGLPQGQMGNSEVGHMNLGSGRVVYQDFTRINRAVETGEFASNPVFGKVFNEVKDADSALHIMGLLSPGGVHSHEEQIFALIRCASAAGVQRVYLHAFLDGRDTPPRSAMASLDAAQDLFQELGCGGVMSLCGRYYAMDRDNNWDRQARAYNLLARGEAPFHAQSATAALLAAYDRDENDEFVQPTSIHDEQEPPRGIGAQDSVIFMNFRADRARQLTRAMTEEDFSGFERRSFAPPAHFVTLTQYAADIKAPEMSAGKVTDQLVQAIQGGEFDVIVCNYANGDMVGHSGKLLPAIKAVETLDACIARLEEAIVSVGGNMLITADHGNVEQMRDPNSDQEHTAHTSNLVPLVYVGSRPVQLRSGGSLCDVAPTLLDLMHMDAPDEMTGNTLITPA